MYARVTTLKADPAKRDTAVSVIENTVIPAARKMSGFAGGYWLSSEDGTRVLAITLFDSESALKDSDAQAEKIRREGTSASGATVQSVEVFEVIAQG